MAESSAIPVGKAPQRDRGRRIARLLSLIPVAIVALWLPIPASAACKLTFRDLDNVSLTGGDSYDIFSPQDAATLEVFRVRHQKSDPCTFVVGFGTGDANTYDRKMSRRHWRLAYQIYDSASKTNVLKDVPEASTSEIFSGTFEGEDVDEREFTFHVVVPALQILPPGHYDDHVRITVYEGSVTDFFERESKNVRFRARVRPTLQASVTAVNGAFNAGSTSWNMAFGTLDRGESQYADLIVRGNVDYNIFIKSDNKGALRHLRYKDQLVPYTMLVEGAAVDLRHGVVKIAGGEGPTPVEGQRRNIQVTIGSIEGLTAGDYRDDVSIVVRSH